MSSDTISPPMTEALRTDIGTRPGTVALKQALTDRERALQAGLAPEVYPGAAESLRSDKPQWQVVLVLQGGGALGAYQAGVYQDQKAQARKSAR